MGGSHAPAFERAGPQPGRDGGEQATKVDRRSRLQHIPQGAATDASRLAGVGTAVTGSRAATAANGFATVRIACRFVAVESLVVGGDDSGINRHPGRAGRAGVRVRMKPVASTISKMQCAEADRSQGMAPGARIGVASSLAIVAGVSLIRKRQSAPEQLVRKGIGAYILNSSPVRKIESTRVCPRSRLAAVAQSSRFV